MVVHRGARRRSPAPSPCTGRWPPSCARCSASASTATWSRTSTRRYDDRRRSAGGAPGRGAGEARRRQARHARPAARGRGRSGRRRRADATAWTSRSRRMRYSSPRISTSNPASGAKSTRSPSSTLRTVGPDRHHLGPHQPTVQVGGGRDEDPAPALAVAAVVGRQHEQPVGGHADRLLHVGRRTSRQASRAARLRSASSGRRRQG